MQTTLKIIAAFFIGSILSWFVTRYYYEDMNTSRAEAMIAKEIQILESVAPIKPPCDRLEDPQATVIDQNQNHVIIWKMAGDKQKIEKFVVNPKFESAYEVIKNECRPN